MTKCDRCGVVIDDNEMYGYAEVSICNSVDNEHENEFVKFPAGTGRKLVCVFCTSKVMSLLTNGEQEILPTGDQYKLQQKTVRGDYH